MLAIYAEANGQKLLYSGEGPGFITKLPLVLQKTLTLGKAVWDNSGKKPESWRRE